MYERPEPVCPSYFRHSHATLFPIAGALLDKHAKFYKPIELLSNVGCIRA